jgi:hypothetical protein
VPAERTGATPIVAAASLVLAAAAFWWWPAGSPQPHAASPEVSAVNAAPHGTAPADGTPSAQIARSEVLAPRTAIVGKVVDASGGALADCLVVLRCTDPKPEKHS